MEKLRKTCDVRTFLKGKDKNLLEKLILENLHVIHEKKYSYQSKQQKWDDITLMFNSQSEIKKNRQQIRKWYKNNRSYLLTLVGSQKNTNKIVNNIKVEHAKNFREARQDFVAINSPESNHLKNSVDCNGFYTTQLTNMPSELVSANDLSSSNENFVEEPEYDLNNFQDPHTNEETGDEDFQFVDQTDISINTQQNELMSLRIEHERMKIFETRKRIEVVNLQKMYWKRQIQLQSIPDSNL